MTRLVQPPNPTRLAQFLKAECTPEIIRRLDVGVGLVPVTFSATEQVGADNVLRPIPATEFIAPPEMRIMRAGVNESPLKGDYVFDEESARLLAAYTAAWGNDYSSDFEHAAFHPDMKEAPASSWYRLDVRADGLYAVGMQWVERAAELLRTFQYRYISPAFIRDAETKRVLVYFNFALTNIPATANMAPILNSRVALHSMLGELAEDVRQPSVQVPASLPQPSPQPHKELPTMELSVLIALLGLPANADQAAITAAISAYKEHKAGTCALLNLAPTATLAEAQARISELTGFRSATGALFSLGSSPTAEQVKGEVTKVREGAAQLGALGEEMQALRPTLLSLTGSSSTAEVPVKIGNLGKLASAVATLTGKTDTAEQIAVLTANRDGAAQVAELSNKVTTLSAELDGLKATSAQDKQKALIDSAISSGRLPPALRSTAESFFKDHGQKAGEAYLASLPEHPAGRPPAVPTPAPGTTAEPLVSEELKMNASRLGITKEALELAAKQDAEARAKRGQMRTAPISQ